MQIGNCGSPIETEAGWLLLTHGVGPMRRYCIGATLLDLDDPCRVIGLTREPLIVPTDDERTGYVPNVVYSCGALLHNRMLIIPYALSDLSTTVARVDLDDLLRSLVEPSMAALADRNGVYGGLALSPTASSVLAKSATGSPSMVSAPRNLRLTRAAVCGRPRVNHSKRIRSVSRHPGST